MFIVRNAVITLTNPSSDQACIRHCPIMPVTGRSCYFCAFPAPIFSLVSADFFRYRRAKTYDCAKERGQANRHN